MPKKKSRRRTKSRKRSKNQVSLNKLVWAILLFTATLVVVLVVVAQRGEQPDRVYLPPEPPAPQQPAVTGKDLRTELETFLSAAGFSAQQIHRELKADSGRYTVLADVPDDQRWEELLSRLQGLSAQLTVRRSSEDILTVHADDRLLLSVFFVPPPEPQPAGPQVVIIMDDLGRGLSTAKALLGLQQKITFAILPGESDATRVAHLAHEAGREVLLHLPMEPQGYPAVNPGDDALFVRFNQSEIRSRVDQLLSRVPHAVGANNHMGSRFTEDRNGMGVVMEEMRDRGLFFVDSLTTGRSVVSESAAGAGVPSIERDVFLDNVADTEMIIRQLRRLTRKAREQGYAVGICHPYPETLEALRQEVPKIAAEGVRFVTVSTLLKQKRRG